MPSVLDTTQDCSSAIQCLKQQGYGTVGSYYARPGNEWKTIKPPEAVALAHANMNIVAVYQDRQNQATDFDLTKGQFAGKTAWDYAENVGLAQNEIGASGWPSGPRRPRRGLAWPASSR